MYQDEEVDYLKNAAKKKALRDALHNMEREIDRLRSNPAPGISVWRRGQYDEATWAEEVKAAERAYRELEDEIISLEHEERDPIEYSERRAELYAEMALTGVHDDVSLYLHTPQEEERFQRAIWAQIEMEDALERGAPMCGTCPTCGDPTWDDDWASVDGYDVCYQTCYEEAKAWLYFVAWITGKSDRIKVNRYGEDPWISEDEDDDD